MSAADSEDLLPAVDECTLKPIRWILDVANVFAAVLNTLGAPVMRMEPTAVTALRCAHRPTADRGREEGRDDVDT